MVTQSFTIEAGGLGPRFPEPVHHHIGAPVGRKHRVEDVDDDAVVDHPGHALDQRHAVLGERRELQGTGEREPFVGEDRKRQMQPLHRLALVGAVLGREAVELSHAQRFQVGEVTRTDVAQSESRLAAGRSQVLTAEANHKTSAAVYRQVVGVNPGRLTAASPVDRFSPASQAASINAGTSQHPNVVNAQYNVDVATSQVKVAEGALLPNLSLQGNVTQNWMPSVNIDKQLTASALAQVTVPIYQGGAEYSAIRQAKETLGQRRIDLDTARDQVRQTVVQSWGQLDAAKANIEATQAQVQAAEIALNGVREEARVGQRTTLDVLNAQQELVNARVSLVGAQRDRVVASYSLLSAVGRLSPQTLGLRVPAYDPRVHYHQVRDSWVGVRTPDGR